MQFSSSSRTTREVGVGVLIFLVMELDSSCSAARFLAGADILGCGGLWLWEMMAGRYVFRRSWFKLGLRNEKGSME